MLKIRCALAAPYPLAVAVNGYRCLFQQHVEPDLLFSITCLGPGFLS